MSRSSLESDSSSAPERPSCITKISSDNVITTTTENCYNRTTINNYYRDHQTQEPETFVKGVSDSAEIPKRRRKGVRFREDSLACTSSVKSVWNDWKAEGLSRLPNPDAAIPMQSPSTEPSSSRATATTAGTTGGGRCRIKPELRENVKLPKAVRRNGIIRRFMQSDFFKPRHSIPLWHPSAPLNLPLAFRNTYICVGDVGYFNDNGGFQVEFNVFLSAEENRTLGFTTPDGFQPFTVEGSHEVSDITVGSQSLYDRHSGGFERADVDKSNKLSTAAFQWPNTSVGESGGSLLVLPMGYLKDNMTTRTMKKLGRHFEEQSWWRTDGVGPSGKALKLVTCTYKSRAWALAGFEANKMFSMPFFAKRQLSAKLFKLKEDVDLYEWNCDGDIDARTGPLQKELVDGMTASLLNQCIAIEVSSISESESLISSTRTKLTRRLSRVSGSTVH